MNRTNKNQVMVLMSLVVGWVGLLIWQFGHSDEPAHVPLKNVRGTKVVGKAASVAAPVTLQVNLDRLAAIKGQREATFSTPRNIFASLTPPVEPPPPPRKGRARPQPKVEAPAAPPEPEEEPVVEGPKGPTAEEIERLRIATELNQFRYVGFMTVGDGPQKKKTMAVLVKNEEMHLVQAGETIGGEVLVKAVSASEITLQDVGSKITQVIPVTDEPSAPDQPTQ
ncbi:hypothetical protein FBQ96_11945 [Nitrospirales bacterium NOB]|nr:MAG: hypothetical protein UZ03_NOB001001569 [Nitrospira sp. OLB3]MBV6469306.1 hypothetical protein [Nitrospirota bacterium]MCE7966472.1 hypothetical protein [Nitrospira sp. NTP2]MCK6494393.1 hypothetical protein [Nitrospira sp.]MDL1890273.1 hypothetical protein [Nitrospirales bacterium NOB]MEB2339897.1 hypothetical protein [Nitrospirales bacterium]